MNVILSYILIAFAFLSFIASLALLFLNLQADIYDLGLFKNSTLKLEEKLYIDFATPDSLLHSTMWQIIYIANALGLLYILVGAFVPPRMSPVKVSPTLTPPFFLITYSFAFLMTIGWLFASDARILPLAMVFLLLGAIAASASIGLSAKRIQDEIFALEIKGNVMMWMIRILVQNPLCIFATWLVVAAILTMTDIIIYQDSPHNESAVLRGVVDSRETGSLIGLGVLLAVSVIWFILENFVWEKYCRYLFTIYPVLIYVAAGVVAKVIHNRKNLNWVLILASVELAVFFIALVVRICLLIYKIKYKSDASP